MAEIDSRQKTLIAAGDKVGADVQGKVACVCFNTPAAAAWAQNDTFASGMKIPAGSRILASSIVSHGAFGTSVTLDVGLRAWDDGTVIDADGIAAALDVSAAGRTSLNNGALVAAGVGYLTTEDVEPYATLAGANPTDNIQAMFEIFYLPPG